MAGGVVQKHNKSGDGSIDSSLLTASPYGILDPRMVDIHCHLLPGLDDGPDSLEEALAMAEMAIADGITHVIATPHANDRYRFDPHLVDQHRNELRTYLGERLMLATGCDFHLSLENLEDLNVQPTRYTLNQKNYLLVEFADFAIPPTIEETLYQLQLARLSPIITHPERNGLIQAQPERLYRWVHQGCYVQVTAQSLLGRFGTKAQRLVRAWLDEDRIHFFASDAHNLTSRPLRLRETYDAVMKRRGKEVANALFHDNPLAAFEGRPLPYVPEPGARGTKRPSVRRRKRFFF